MESRATGRMSSRRRPLSTCAVSSIEIARKAYAEAQRYNGAIGIMTNKIGSLAYLLMYALHYNQYLLLALLAFLDDRILALENAIEASFPPLNCVFNSIDKLVQMIEILPEYFDVCVRNFSATLSQVPFLSRVLVWTLSWLNVWFFVSKFPAMLFRVPFVDRVLVCAISWLTFWLSTLIHWGSESPREKEIVVDVDYNDSSHESADASEADHVTDFPNYVGNETVKGTYNNNPEKAMPGSYKEALEKGKNEKIPTIEGSISKDVLGMDGEGSYKDALEKGIQIEEDGVNEGVPDGKVSYRDVLEKGIQIEEDGVNEDVPDGKVSYRDVLEKGKIEKLQNKEYSKQEDIRPDISVKTIGEDGRKEETNVSKGGSEGIRLKSVKTVEESTSEEDPILELFESAWLMTPREKSRAGSISNAWSFEM